MRIGRIPYINCYPVYGAMDRGLVMPEAELVSGTASDLNDLLAAGELDLSVTPLDHLLADTVAWLRSERLVGRV